MFRCILVHSLMNFPFHSFKTLKHSVREVFVPRIIYGMRMVYFDNKISSQLLWLCQLLQDLGAPQYTTSPIYCDNWSSIHIVHNNVFHKHTNHIEINCRFVHHHLHQGTLRLRLVPLTKQLADVFTKPHPPSRFCALVIKLKLVSSLPL